MSGEFQNSGAFTIGEAVALWALRAVMTGRDAGTIRRDWSGIGVEIPVDSPLRPEKIVELLLTRGLTLRLSGRDLLLQCRLDDGDGPDSEFQLWDDEGFDDDDDDDGDVSAEAQVQASPKPESSSARLAAVGF